MPQPKPLAAALTAALLLVGAAPSPARSDDQESACGAILCLVGGSGVTECAGYLSSYFAITATNPTDLFNRRLDFLNQCPAADLPGDLRPLIANYGATCQPTQLVSYLNQQIRACEARNFHGNARCQPASDGWRLCAPFYDHAYTTYEAPVLHEHCDKTPDADGALVQRCSYIWTLAGEVPPADSQTPWPGLAPTGFGQPSN